MLSEGTRIDYVGTGLLTDYDYTFKIFAASDLVVAKADTNGEETVLDYLTDYSVDGVGDSNGGTVSLADELEDGYSLVIRRARSFAQETDVRNQQQFYPSVFEDKFDEIAMGLQRLDEEISRSLRVHQTVNPSLFDTFVPFPEANKAIGWNADGTALRNLETSEVSPVTMDADAMTFYQLGTGAVVRTARSRLRDTVSVRDFGATGDGTTDDTAAFQAALNFCSLGDGSHRRTLLIPFGVYKITSSLNCYSDVVGEGNHQVGDGSTLDWRGTGFCIRQRAPYNVGAKLGGLRVDCSSNANAAHGAIEAVEGMVSGQYDCIEVKGATSGKTAYGIYVRGDAASANATNNRFVHPSINNALVGIQVGDDVLNGMGSNTVIINPYINNSATTTTCNIRFTGGQNTVIGGDLTATGTGFVVEFAGAFCQNNSLISVELSSAAGGGGVKITAATTASLVFTALGWRVSDVLGTLVSDAVTRTHSAWIGVGTRSLGKLEGPGYAVQRESTIANGNDPAAPALYGGLSPSGGGTGFLHIAGDLTDNAGRVLLGANGEVYSATIPVDPGGVSTVGTTSGKHRFVSSANGRTSLTTKAYVDLSDGSFCERTRTVAMGVWTTPTFAAGDYTGSGSMTVTVGSGDVTTMEYMLIGKTMFINFLITNLTIGGTPDTIIRFALPGGAVPAKQSASMLHVKDNGAWEVGYVEVKPSDGAFLRFLRGVGGNGGNWTASADNTSLIGQIKFDIA